MLHVRHIGEEYAGEADLTDVFSTWGQVSQVTIRTRRDEKGEAGPAGDVTSYALVKMANVAQADLVMEAYAAGDLSSYKSFDQAMHLKVTRFDKEVAVNSSGAMAGALTAEHTTIAAT